MQALILGNPLRFSELSNLIFNGPLSLEIEFGSETLDKVDTSHRSFLAELEKRGAIYGVTTGFGESCRRRVSVEQSETLQQNLISYLTCGSGKILSLPVRRAMTVFRLQSLAQGYSGVSKELIERLMFFVKSDWTPLVPAEGSLGASGDLVPLAYLAGAIQGLGEVESPMGIQSTAQLLAQFSKSPYRLKPKEGLALVNGTSAMAAQCYVNTVEACFLLQISILEASWLCLAISGKKEPFGELVNSKAKNFSGQSRAAAAITHLLSAENYDPPSVGDVDGIEIQERYSLRCAPQILGPIWETLEQCMKWIELEVNGVSDNPLVSSLGKLESGGNFYGGYLSHGMDYLKISLAHMADILDRQVTMLLDENANRGLPPNLVNWPGLSKEEQPLHHGLKGIHQAVSAITSDVMAKAIPSGIFSRSTESHNQDKVSLGMTAALSCEGQLESLFRIHAMGLICLAQALDLRGIQLRGSDSKYWYDQIRSLVKFVDRDRPLDKEIVALSNLLRHESHKRGGQLGF